MIKKKLWIPVVMMFFIIGVIFLLLRNKNSNVSFDIEQLSEVSWQKNIQGFGEFLITDKFIVRADDFYEITDKQTGIRTPLCFIPGCKHSIRDEKCNATNMKQESICIYENSIYGIGTEKVSQTEEQLVIYRSDINRANFDIYDKIRLKQGYIHSKNMAGIYDGYIYWFVTYENAGQRKANITDKLKTSIGLVKYDIINKTSEIVKVFDTGYDASAWVTCHDEGGFYFYLSYNTVLNDNAFVFEDYYYSIKENTFVKTEGCVEYIDDKNMVVLEDNGEEKYYRWYNSNNELINEYKFDENDNFMYVNTDFIEKMERDEETGNRYSYLFNTSGELLCDGKRHDFFIIGEDNEGFLVTNIDGKDFTSVQGYIYKKDFYDALSQGDVNCSLDKEIIVRKK